MWSAMQRCCAAPDLAPDQFAVALVRAPCVCGAIQVAKSGVWLDQAFRSRAEQPGPRNQVHEGVRFVRGQQFQFRCWLFRPRGANQGAGQAAKVRDRDEGETADYGNDEAQGTETKEGAAGCRPRRAGSIVSTCRHTQARQFAVVQLAVASVQALWPRRAMVGDCRISFHPADCAGGSV